MKKMFRTLWSNEAGFIVSAELILVATLLVLGMVVGMQTIRDTITAEMADVAAAFGVLNQSYTYGGVTGHASSVAGSSFTDLLDFCDNTGTSGTCAPQCVTFLVPATSEM